MARVDPAPVGGPNDNAVAEARLEDIARSIALATRRPGDAPEVPPTEWGPGNPSAVGIRQAFGRMGATIGTATRALRAGQILTAGDITLVQHGRNEPLILERLKRAIPQLAYAEHTEGGTNIHATFSLVCRLCSRIVHVAVLESDTDSIIEAAATSAFMAHTCPIRELHDEVSRAMLDNRTTDPFEYAEAMAVAWMELAGRLR